MIESTGLRQTTSEVTKLGLLFMVCLLMAMGLGSGTFTSEHDSLHPAGRLCVYDRRMYVNVSMYRYTAKVCFKYFHMAELLSWCTNI